MQSLQPAPSPLSARGTAFAGARPTCSAAAARPAGCRPRCVEVYADKGKRRGRTNGPAGTPRQQQELNLPPVDKENAQFVLFVRSKLGLKRWLPLNVVTGGSQANVLVKGLESDLTKETSMSTLVRDIAKTIYKDKVQIEALVREKFAPLKFAKEFEYGMCILNKEKPRESLMGLSGVMLLPAEGDIVSTPVESLAAGAAGVLDTIGTGFANFTKSIQASGSALNPPPASP